MKVVPAPVCKGVLGWGKGKTVANWIDGCSLKLGQCTLPLLHQRPSTYIRAFHPHPPNPKLYPTPSSRLFRGLCPFSITATFGEFLTIYIQRLLPPITSQIRGKFFVCPGLSERCDAVGWSPSRPLSFPWPDWTLAPSKLLPTIGSEVAHNPAIRLCLPPPIQTIRRSHGDF